MGFQPQNLYFMKHIMTGFAIASHLENDVPLSLVIRNDGGLFKVFAVMSDKYVSETPEFVLLVTKKIVDKYDGEVLDWEYNHDLIEVNILLKGLQEKAAKMVDQKDFVPIINIKYSDTGYCSSTISSRIKLYGNFIAPVICSLSHKSKITDEWVNESINSCVKSISDEISDLDSKKEILLSKTNLLDNDCSKTVLKMIGQKRAKSLNLDFKAQNASEFSKILLAQKALDSSFLDPLNKQKFEKNLYEMTKLNSKSLKSSKNAQKAMEI